MCLLTTINNNYNNTCRCLCLLSGLHGVPEVVVEVHVCIILKLCVHANVCNCLFTCIKVPLRRIHSPSTPTTPKPRSMTSWSPASGPHPLSPSLSSQSGQPRRHSSEISIDGQRYGLCVCVCVCVCVFWVLPM